MHRTALHLKLYTRTILKVMIWITAMLFLLLQAARAEPVGTLTGVVTNGETQQPLLGVNVILMDTQMGAATHEQGEFIIQNVPVGTYSLAFHFIGFEKIVRTDVIVRPGGNVYVSAEMKEVVLQGEQVTVSAGYFQKDDSEPVSVAR